MKYARVLLEHCPHPTTKLFIDYYTGQYRPRRKKDAEVPKDEKERSAGGLHNLASLIPLPYFSTSKTGQTKSTPADPQLVTEMEDPVEYEVPKPRTSFSSFVDHPQEFIVFLEALIQQKDLKEDDKVDLYTTLFEMYLDTASHKKDPSEKKEWESKAKQLIEGKDVGIESIIQRDEKLLIVYTDSSFYLECSLIVGFVGLSGRNNTCQGTTRITIRHPAIICVGERHCGSYQSPEKIRLGRTTTLH